MNSSSLDRNYKELGNAIVIQTIADWQDYERDLRRYPDRSRLQKKRERQKEECENFFLSDDCEMFCDISGEFILNKMKE